MSLKTFQLSEFPVFYYTIKVISLVTFLIGSITLTDYYLPAEETRTDILETKYSYGAAGLPKKLMLITRDGLITLPPDISFQIGQGMEVKVERSPIFNVVKSYVFFKKGQKIHTLVPDNIFSMEAFFAKFLLLSLFTLLYTNPAYWMIALSMINVVIALIFTGLPKITIVLTLVISATVAFIYSMVTSGSGQTEA